MAMSAEAVMYKDGDIEVSKSRVVIAGTDYSTANITSVALVKNYTRGLILMLIGVVVLVAAFAFLRTAWYFRDVLIAGACVAIFGYYSLRYTMIFHTNSGDIPAYASPNRTYMQQLVQTVNQALIKDR
jgi:uncharacterized protein DUF6232